MHDGNVFWNAVAAQGDGRGDCRGRDLPAPGPFVANSSGWVDQFTLDESSPDAACFRRGFGRDYRYRRHGSALR